MATKLLNSKEKIAATPSVRNEPTRRLWTLADVRFELEKVREILIREGYEPGIVQSIAFNPRLTRACGRTYSFRGTFEMDFSVDFFKKGSEKSIRDTIAHEVVHTVPGCLNHKSQFKVVSACLEKHGYHVERLCKDEGYTKSVAQKGAPSTKYHVVCEDCGWDDSKRVRLSKMFKGIMQAGQRRYSCPVCGSHKLSVYRVDSPGLETQLKSIRI